MQCDGWIVETTLQKEFQNPVRVLAIVLYKINYSVVLNL